MTVPHRVVRVLARSAAADEVAVFDLVADDGAPLPAYTPGAHVEVVTPAGPVRAYSLCRPHAAGAPYRIAVQREAAGRGGSASLHASLQAGHRLQIGAPRNLFPLDETAPRSLLLAGGIGVTPLLAMAHRLHALGADFVLHHAVRSWARAVFRDELRDGPFADRVVWHVDDTGGPADLDRLLAAEPADSHVYVCGPAGFIDAACTAARRRGLPDAQVHVERFAAPAAPVPAAAGFDVVLARRGQRVAVPPGTPITVALAVHGAPVPTSCEHGICGTCVTRVLAGAIVHHDFCLSDDERASGRWIVPCCSVARDGELVLDL